MLGGYPGQSFLRHSYFEAVLIRLCVIDCRLRSTHALPPADATRHRRLLGCWALRHLLLSICPKHARLSQQSVGRQADLFDPQSWGDIVVADCSSSNDKTSSLGPLDPHWNRSHVRSTQMPTCCCTGGMSKACNAAQALVSE